MHYFDSSLFRVFVACCGFNVSLALSPYLYMYICIHASTCVYISMHARLHSVSLMKNISNIQAHPIWSLETVCFAVGNPSVFIYRSGSFQHGAFQVLQDLPNPLKHHTWNAHTHIRCGYLVQCFFSVCANYQLHFKTWRHAQEAFSLQRNHLRIGLRNDV